MGLQAALLSALLYRIENFFHRLPLHWMWWPAVGAVAVGLGGLIDAHVLSAGYGNIENLLQGSLTLRVVLALLVVKALAWLVALGSETSGGVLAPLLILGDALGYLVGSVLPGSPGFWAMIGMAGIMSGAMRASHRRAVRRRADRPLRRIARHHRRGDRRLCRERIGDAPLDPYREDRPSRTSHPAGIYRRPARLPPGRRRDDARAGNARRGDAITFFAERATHAAIRSSTRMGG